MQKVHVNEVFFMFENGCLQQETCIVFFFSLIDSTVQIDRSLKCIDITKKENFIY